jgi:PEP-CTERM motif
MLQRLAHSALPLAAVALVLLGARNANAVTVGSLDTWTCDGACGSATADGHIGQSPLGNPQFGFVTTAGSLATGVAPLSIGAGVNTNGSRYVSSAFDATGPVDAYFNYITTDGKAFTDFGWARLVNDTTNTTAAWLFAARSSTKNTKDVIPGGVTTAFKPKTAIEGFADFRFSRLDAPTASFLGESSGTCFSSSNTCGSTGWLHSTVSVASGRYRLEVGVTNVSDGIFDSALAFDLSGLPVQFQMNALFDRAALAPVPEPTSLALMLAGGAAVFAARRRQA